MKELEGKRVLLRPTGNNVPRGKNSGNGCRWADVIKVARVNVTVKFEKGFREEMFRISEYGNRRIGSDCNAGWIIFDSEEAYLEQRKKERLACQISEHLRYSKVLEDMALEKVEKIAVLLEIDSQSEAD